MGTKEKGEAEASSFQGIFDARVPFTPAFCCNFNPRAKKIFPSFPFNLERNPSTEKHQRAKHAEDSTKSLALALAGRSDRKFILLEIKLLSS